MASPARPSDPATTTYIVVTGANSGLGFAICCRLIDEFLPTRPSTHTLHLIPTTRGQSKADDTELRLRKHVAKYARNESSGSPRVALDILEREIGKRIVVTPELVDLNSILSVQRAGKRIKSIYERIDVLVCNAGIGGWLGVDFWGAAKQFFTEGLNFLMEPKYKIGAVGWVTKKQIPSLAEGGKEEEEPKLAEVFCANLFGHYLLSHYLMPVLSKARGEESGRVIWVSTLEAYKRTFSMEDFQGLGTNIAYESSKRLTDLLVLSADLPSTSPYTKPFFSTSSKPPSPGLSASWEDLTPRKASLRSSSRTRTATPPPSQLQRSQSSQSEVGMVRPKMYLSHPGMCVTGIMPIHWILIYLWTGVFYISRFCGNPWHTTTAYPAATSMTWLALADQDTLNEIEASPDTTADKETGVGQSKKISTEGKTRRAVKWGSAVNWIGNERVKKTEVEGWCDGNGVAIRDEEEKSDFEENARECWKRMEDLRIQWEERLKKAGYDELT
ncbi:3-keto-steroid reductase [Venturia nashicola]|uniref:3-keto-steroid reductase n=1 Tax=Venturia nashicola TaxID=86259 RepID=A0A4Z1NHI4_9PEZI|nr:3-keto-steroid reductase [Venturia nashicola]TLD21643.1 3-keto-steroid reductase [Venturia nashicola]